MQKGELWQLRDLQILCRKTSASDTKVSISQAYADLASERINDSDGNPLSILSPVQQFQQYGPGVYLAFKFIKHYMITLLLISPLAMVNVVNLVDSEAYRINDVNIMNMMECTTIAYANPRTANSVIQINLIIIILLAISTALWKFLEKGYVLECSKKCPMTSYFTTVIKEIPQGYNQNDMKEHLETYYGSVHSICTVRNYGEDLADYKKIGELADSLADQMNAMRQDPSRNCCQAVDSFLEYRKKHLEMQKKIGEKTVYPQSLAFITFENVYTREQVLEEWDKRWCFNRKGRKMRQIPLYKNQLVRFYPCKIEPKGISWENMNLSKKQIYLRTGVIVLLLILEIFSCVTLLMVITALESVIFKHHYGNINKQQILALGTQEALRSYCLYLSLGKFKQDPDCNPFVNDYLLYTIVVLSFPVVVTFLNMTLLGEMKFLVSLRRYRYEINKVQWKIIVVSIYFFIRAALIKLLLYREFDLYFFKINFFSMFMPILNVLALVIPIYPNEITIYPDYSRVWLTHISRRIIPISMIALNLTIMIPFARRFWAKWRRVSAALKQTSQAKLKAMLRDGQMDIDTVYANVISIVFFLLLYYPIMPVIFLFVTFTFVLLYWTSKIAFIKSSRKPNVINHNPNRICFRLILLGLIINCFLTPLFFSTISDDKDAPKDYFTVLHQRYTREPMYIVLGVCLIIYWFWSNQIDCILKIVQSYITYRQYVPYEETLTQIKAQVSLDPYSLRKHPAYRNTLKVVCTINWQQNHPHLYFVDYDPLFEEVSKDQLMKQETTKCSVFLELDQILTAQYNLRTLDESCWWKQPWCPERKWYQHAIAVFAVIKATLVESEAAMRQGNVKEDSDRKQQMARSPHTERGDPDMGSRQMTTRKLIP